MSVKVIGKNHLLTGHYQDIIISENKKGNFQVKVTPNKFSTDGLDDAYSHLDYKGLSDIDKIKMIIDYYLNNNTIFILSDNGRVKNHSGSYQAVNGYKTIIDGYKSVNRALYLKITGEKFIESYKKIEQHYDYDRIRHLDKILSYPVINLDYEINYSWYSFTKDGANIGIHIRVSNHDLMDFHDVSFNEKQFLKILVYEYLKKNNFLVKESLYSEGTSIYSSDYTQVMYLNEFFHDILVEVKNEIYASRKNNFKEITLEEYAKTLKLGN